MKLESIQLINFLAHERTELNLSKVTLLAITGENGAGKSSILDGIIWCLFGKVASRGTKNDAIARIGSTETSVILEWYQNDIKYKLKRTLDNKKKSQKLELAINDVVISERKKTEVEELINNIIKVPADIFLLTNYLQQDGESFLDLKPTDRKAFLTKILQLDKYKQVQNEAKTAKSKLVNAKANLDGQFRIISDEITECINMISSKPELENDLNKLKAEHNRVLTYLTEAADRKIKEKNEKATQKTQLETSLDLKEKDLKDLNEKLNEFSKEVIVDFSAEITKLTAEKSQLQVQDTELLTQIERNRSQFTLFKEEYEKIQKLIQKASNLDTSTPCPTCLQNISEEHVEKIKEIYEEQAQEIKEKGSVSKKFVEENNPKRASIKEQISERENKIYQLEIQKAKISKALEIQKETKEKAEKLIEEINNIKEILKELDVEAISPEVLEKVRKAELYEKDLKNQIEQATASVNNIDFVEKKYQTLLDKKEGLVVQIKNVEHNIQIYSLIIDACHPQKGIPAKIIENSIHPLEKIANDILEHFPGSKKFNIYFQTLTDDGKETLELIVKTSNTTVEKYYEQLSGGEKMRINLALRIALIRMINTMFGVENRTFIIDEGFHSLSVDIRVAAFEILSKLHGVWFDKVITITHTPEIVDCVPYRLILKLDKDKTAIDYKNF